MFKLEFRFLFGSLLARRFNILSLSQIFTFVQLQHFFYISYLLYQLFYCGIFICCISYFVVAHLSYLRAFLLTRTNHYSVIYFYVWICTSIYTCIYMYIYIWECANPCKLTFAWWVFSLGFRVVHVKEVEKYFYSRKWRVVIYVAEKCKKLYCIAKSFIA